MALTPAQSLSIYTSQAQLSALLESDKFGIVSVKSYGAKGDGVTDDTNVIASLCQSGKTLFFPTGEYLIKSNILIQNKTNIVWIGAENVKIIDDCKNILTADGITYAKTPYGILFYGCTDITIQNIKFVNTKATYAEVNTSKKSERIPQLGFENTSNLNLVNVCFDGLVGPYITNTYDLALKTRLESSLLRIYNCSNIYIDNIKFMGNAGGGEFISIGNSKNLAIINSAYEQVGATTFWSYLKSINNNDVLLRNWYIKSTSTGSLMDVSGNRIRIENLYIDTPGNIIDITNEWIGIQTDTNNLVMKNCYTTGKPPITEILDYTEAYAAMSRIKNVYFDNVVSGKGYFNGRLMQRMQFTNGEIFNQEYWCYAPITLPIENEMPFSHLFENVKVYCDNTVTKTAPFTELHLLGVTKVNNCNIELPITTNNSGLRILDRWIMNTTKTTTDLRDSISKAIFCNTSFKNTVIQVDANAEFINCTFENCGFGTTATGKLLKPTIAFKHCDFVFISTIASVVTDGRPFKFTTLNELKMIDCTIKGELVNSNGYDLCSSFKTLGSKVNIENCVFDIKKSTGDGYVFLAHTNGTEYIDIKVKNSKFTSNISYGIVTYGEKVVSPTNFSKLEVFNNVFDSENGVRITNPTAEYNNSAYLTVIGNRFTPSTISQLDTGKTSFAGNVVYGNGEF